MNPDLADDLHVWIVWAVKNKQSGLADLLNRVVDALAARNAACGHLPNELVAKALQWAQAVGCSGLECTADEWDALRAATFEVTE